MASDPLTSIRLVQVLHDVAAQGTCRKRRVGSLIVQNERILLSAANGTPPGMPTCLDGGCIRCANGAAFDHGMGYDLCICLHAEEAVLAKALLTGISLKGSMLVTSYQPCFMCAKLIVASGIHSVRYVEPWRVPEVEDRLPGLAEQYERIWEALPGGCLSLAEYPVV
jgi:dCMP deaminase